MVDSTIQDASALLLLSATILLHKEIILTHFTNHLCCILFIAYSSQPPSHYYMFWTDSGSSMEQQAAVCSNTAKVIEGHILILCLVRTGFCFLSWLKRVELQIPTLFGSFTACFNIKNRISHCILS